MPCLLRLRLYFFLPTLVYPLQQEYLEGWTVAPNYYTDVGGLSNPPSK